mgnify:CR=1 FL=1
MINIPSYMGGVDLWQNEDYLGDFHPQSMHDKRLEVIGICGAWHLGKLQVGTHTFCFSCNVGREWVLCNLEKSVWVEDGQIIIC